MKWVNQINPSRPNPGRRKNIKLIFILCGAYKGFMKAFIKSFEAPQRSVKIKI